MLNIEKNTRWILVAVFVASFLGIVFSSFGRTNLVLSIFGVLSVIFGLALWVEGGWITWLRKSGWRSISSDDAFVIGSFVIGTIMILGGALIFPAIRNASPEWLINFVTPLVSVTSVIGLILSIWFLFTPKPQ